MTCKTQCCPAFMLRLLGLTPHVAKPETQKSRRWQHGVTARYASLFFKICVFVQALSLVKTA